MARPINKFMIGTGVFTLVQAIAQIVFTSLAIAQHYCKINFLQRFPLLVVIRLLYFTNYGTCESMIRVGVVYEELADSAFIAITKQSFTATRTLWINSINLGLGVVWVLCSYLLIRGGSLKHHSDHSHWPWLVSTVIVSVSDLISFVCLANDSYSTKRLSDIANLIDATTAGLGTNEVDTTWVSWAMAIVYTRFGIGLTANFILMSWGVVDCTRFRSSVTSSEVERNRRDSMYSEQPTISPRSDDSPAPGIPRPGISRSFRAMKTFLFNEAGAQRAASTRDRQRGVNFSENFDLPDLENMIGEQRRRLEMAVDTSGRRSPAQASRSLARADSFVNLPGTSTGYTGPGTSAQLQGQMPWAYIHASSNRMRDQLPPDEDLPPVPLPDYTAFQSARKASVHRAASSLSSMTQKKEYLPYQSQRQQPVPERSPPLAEPEQIATITNTAESSEEGSVYCFMPVGKGETPERLPLPPPPPPPLLPPPPPPPRPRRPWASCTGFVLKTTCCIYMLRVLGLAIMFGISFGFMSYIRNWKPVTK